MIDLFRDALQESSLIPSLHRHASGPSHTDAIHELAMAVLQKLGVWRTRGHSLDSVLQQPLVLIHDSLGDSTRIINLNSQCRCMVVSGLEEIVVFFLRRLQQCVPSLKTAPNVPQIISQFGIMTTTGEVTEVTWRNLLLHHQQVRRVSSVVGTSWMQCMCIGWMKYCKTPHFHWRKFMGTPTTFKLYICQLLYLLQDRSSRGYFTALQILSWLLYNVTDSLTATLQRYRSSTGYSCWPVIIAARLLG